jgi:hypothetical protein
LEVFAFFSVSTRYPPNVKVTPMLHKHMAIVASYDYTCSRN